MLDKKPFELECTDKSLILFQLADKRKNMMEDFANQCSKSVEQAKLEAKSVSDCEAQLREELKMCELQNCEMETRIDKVIEENSVLSAFLDQVKQQNSLLQFQLESAESQLKETKQSLAEQISALQSKHFSTCHVRTFFHFQTVLIFAVVSVM